VFPTQNGIDSSPIFEGKSRKWEINAPGTAKKMQREIASIRRVISAAGNIQYTTPRTSEGHADRAWALMLALHACSTSNPMIDALRARISGGQPGR
jgi:phage FluMu gp28-like protein